MSSKSDSNMRQRFKPPNAAPKSSKVLPKPPPTQQQLPKGSYHVEPISAFYILLGCHLLAAFFSPIQDCDEVFNYWEPTHYLTHGNGFQTWEYSPDYAIRSWAYAGLHALVTLVGKAVPFLGEGKAAEFYFLRIFLGFICALCESRLYSKIAAVMNQRIAMIFLLIMATSPGMYHASIAYLPSSFAMYFTMLAMAGFMDWRGGLRTAQGIWCIGVGATLGWPFVIAMCIPFVLEEVFLASMSDVEGRVDLYWRVTDGAVRTLFVFIFQHGIDFFFYKKAAFVPVNIVWYNVLGGKGPDLYGTEPWHFYIRNLVLNFHLWVPLALMALPLLLIQNSLGAKGAMRASYLRGIVFLSPLYLWLAIFTFQPHKEERFMYPAYPALAINAAVALHIILANIESTNPKDVISKIPVQIRNAGILGFVLAAVTLSAFRTIGTMTAFGAPLSIYKPLHQPGMTRSGDTMCLGKEWYRFPSHYLLPAGVKGKFIKSEFSGLLPGEFSEASEGFGIWPGTWLVPAGMNDENQEDLSKYTNVKHCTFLVDSHLPSTEVTSLEPNYIQDEATWDKIQCLPFLDAASTGIVGRLGWVPDVPFIPAQYRRTWGEYCLLKRKRKQNMSDRRMHSMPSIETLQ